MMRLALKWSLVALVSIAVSAVYAQEPTVFRERTRFLGMGGVGIAVVDDESALFYNPAALTKVDGTKWSLINLQARVSEDILDLDDIADEVDA
ncbi:MAG TPA: hypothetical protein EYP10_00730, partial [Armatimonadetes bacterium]|nr:hypothetical protein [Armatimonadota bacterium]